MASINYENYTNHGFKETNEKTSLSEVSRLDQIKTTQYYIKSDNLLFDFVELDFGNMGSIVDVWLSFLGEDFKMKIDMMSTEDYKKLDIQSYLQEHLERGKNCLECKSKLLEGLCDFRHKLAEEEDDEED